MMFTVHDLDWIFLEMKLLDQYDVIELHFSDADFETRGWYQSEYLVEYFQLIDPTILIWSLEEKTYSKQYFVPISWWKHGIEIRHTFMGNLQISIRIL